MTQQENFFLTSKRLEIRPNIILECPEVKVFFHFQSPLGGPDNIDDSKYPWKVFFAFIFVIIHMDQESKRSSAHARHRLARSLIDPSQNTPIIFKSENGRLDRKRIVKHLEGILIGTVS
ncbi:hypothetical protein ACJX0J_006357, partial [Zea mays]